MLDTFIKTKKKKPESPQDWAEVMRMSYPNNDLPTDLASTSAASFYSAGFNQPTTASNPAPIVPTNASQMNTNLGADQQAAQQEMKAAGAAQDALPTGNEALRILQEAIKAKAAPRDFKDASIGESEIFKQAGIGGFGALSQSLATRGQEMEMNRADFTNTVAQMADVYKASANKIQSRYDKAVEQYKFVTQTLNDNLQQMQKDEQEMRILKQKSQLDKELENLRSANDLKNGLRLKSAATPSDILDAEKSGYIWRDGQLLEDTDLNRGIVNGYNISKYATDPNHEHAVASIVNNIGVGNFQSNLDVDGYIRGKYPNSPVTGSMVMQAAKKYNVDPEMLVAMMEQDSSLGTAGKGAKTFNPGNVGNDDAGNIRNYGDWQSGVNAVASWLSKNKVPKKEQDSRNAVALFDKLNTQQQQRVEARISDYETNTKEYKLASTGYRDAMRIKDNTKSPTDDISLVYAFAKAMDPGSVVREGEYATVQKYAQSLADKYKFDVARVLSGSTIMTEEARKGLKATIENRFKSQEETYNSTRKQYADQINGITGKDNGDAYLTDYSEPVKQFRDQQEAQNRQFSLQLPNGKVLKYKSQSELDAAKKKAGL